MISRFPRIGIWIVILVALLSNCSLSDSTQEQSKLAELISKANSDDAEAQHNLGAKYDHGQGVPQDYAETAKWYRLAAEQGYDLAQYNLGLMYAEGQGVTQDYVEAHKWMNIAASLATGADHKKFADSRDTLASMLTPEQLAEAQLRAIEWTAKKKP